jgi:phenylpropionate dioxygenase-like ring-hydroxylating dioxygenase large terminal subunit
MNHARQVQLLERVAAAGPNLAGLHGESSMVHDAAVYTDPDRFDREMQRLFRSWPVLFALSCELAEPGAYRAGTVGGVPLVVVRQDDGTLRAMVNTCRHRAAPVVDDGTTGCAPALSCPYHAWTYALDGSLRSRPGSAGGFDDLSQDLSLLQVPVAEAHGIVFVRAGGREPIDVDAHLSGAEVDLASFGLERYTHIETREHTWPFNWKLVLDTFSEAYHVRTLHKRTLAPTFDSNALIQEPYGPHILGIGLRKDVVDEIRKPKADWNLLPYSTIQYFILPGALVVHQIDHIEVWRLQPVDVRTTTTLTSIYAPTRPHSERSKNYFVKNLDLVLQVTSNEDFDLMAKIQRHLDAGVLPSVVYGRNEPVLAHLHRSIDAAVAGTAQRVPVGAS